MWLLSTATAELRFFPTVDDVPGAYAILSHVWGSVEEEDSFQKVQAAVDACQRREVNASMWSAQAQDIPEADPRDNVVRSLSAQVERLVTAIVTLQQRPLTISEVSILQENPVRTSPGGITGMFLF